MRDGLGYREVSAGPRSSWRRIWAISRWNLSMLTRQRLFWVLIAIGLLHFLVHYVFIYIKAQLVVDKPGFAKFLDDYRTTGTGDAYKFFLEGQARAVWILLTYAGVVLVTNDYRAGGVAFYLSKPINRLDYILGKILSLWLIVGLLTIVPGLILFIEYGFFSTSFDYWIENHWLAWGIIGYSLVIMTFTSSVLLAFGSMCRKASLFVMAWCGFFLVLPAFAALLRTVSDNRYWLLLNFWRNIFLMGSVFFGSRELDNQAQFAFLLTTLATLVSLFVILRKLQAVEVVP